MNYSMPAHVMDVELPRTTAEAARRRAVKTGTPDTSWMSHDAPLQPRWDAIVAGLSVVAFLVAFGFHLAGAV